jgi:hypothetical protein
VKRAPRSRTVPPPLGRAAVLAALALGLGPASAAAQDPAALVDAAIPHDSAISDQYQRVQEALDQVAAVVPDQPLTPPVAESEPVAPPEPAPAPAAPDPKPQTEQYHSETTAPVNVTQHQPSNVNVSIRINSPGDDGPVVQSNNAGGTAEVEQIVERAAPRPEPAAPGAGDLPPAAGDLPDTWEWVWTSACFGGAPSASAAAASPGWSWRWSCDEQGGAEAIAGVRFPDPGVPDADDLIAAVAPSYAAAPPPAAAAPERSRARPARRIRSGPSGAVAGRAGAPPAAGGESSVRPLRASAHAPPATAGRPRHAVRAAARARPGPGDDGTASTLPPGGGPGLGAATALGTVASLLLGIWTAVLVTACVLVIPRLRRRRWSGLAWRLTRSHSARLERPG